jgi:hypothetical protein
MATVKMLLPTKVLQEALDPWIYRRKRCFERWQQCRCAAAAALKLCANLSLLSACALERGDLDLMGPDPSFVHPVSGKRIPLLAAAQSLLKLYLDEMPFKDSRLVFVGDDGGAMDSETLGRQIRDGGRSIGVGDMQASMQATFFYAVSRDDDDEDAARALLKKPESVAEWPSMPRLLARLAEHPLAPYGRITFYDRKTPKTGLFREIFDLTEVRPLSPAERQALRKQYFPEAVVFYEDDLLTATQLGRFFGVDRRKAMQWIRRYRVSRSVGKKEDNGHLNQEWKTKIMAAYDRLLREDGPSIAELHRHLVADLDFPFCIDALYAFFERIGESVPERVGTMTSKWRTIVDRAYETALTVPGSWTGFFLHLQDLYSFPYSSLTLINYLKDRGYPERTTARDHWKAVAVREANLRRPTSLQAFHQELVDEFGLPVAADTLGDYLKENGISIAANAREERKRIKALVAEEARRRRPTSRASFYADMVREYNFPYAPWALWDYLRQSGIKLSEFSRPEQPNQEGDEKGLENSDRGSRVGTSDLETARHRACSLKPRPRRAQRPRLQATGPTLIPMAIPRKTRSIRCRKNTIFTNRPRQPS